MEDSGSIDAEKNEVKYKYAYMCTVQVGFDGKTSHTDLNACSGSLNVTGAS